MITKNTIISTALFIASFFTPLFWTGTGAFAQNNVGIGILVPAPSSLLDLTATDKGLLVPRLTVVQRDAIASPATGLLIYNTDCNVFNYFNGTSWVSIDGINVAGPISGSTNPCQGSTGLVYSIPAVPGATGYNWTVPVGATITLGAGTPSITVDFGNTDGDVCVAATNNCEVSDTLCLAIKLSTAPVSPTAVAASDFTCTSFSANWAASAGASTYLLDVASDASFTTFVSGYNDLNVGNVTIYSVTGLTPSSNYYYRLRVINGCDTSLYSNTISISTTAPVAPTATAASNFTCTSVNANWGAVSGATTYYLEVSTSATFGSGTFVSGYNNVDVNNVTTYNITGLTSSTTYYYRVRAGNGCDTSLYSNTITVSTSAPVAPTAAAASNFTCTSLNANWGAVTGATSYYLEVATTATFTSGTFVSGYNNVDVNNVTTYNVTGLTSSTTYYYRVRAGNGCDTSLYSNTITVSTSAPVAPTAAAASNYTCTSINANWGAVTGATTYYLEVATTATFTTGTFISGYNNVDVNNVTTYNVTGLTSSTTYYYRVRAGNGCDTSLYSNTITVSTSAPVAPTATAPSNFTCTSLNANWGAVTGATTYYLEVSTSATFGSGTFVTGYNNVDVNNVTTYNVTGLTSSTTYYYRVRAGNGCDTSLYSNTITVSTSAPVAPTATAPSNFTCTSINANWGAVSGATTYYLEVATSASFDAGTFVTGYNNINVNNVTTYNVTGLTSSTTYYYRVRAGNGCDTSLYSNTITVSTSAPVAPNAVAASNFTCTSVNANWGAVTGATSYYLEVATTATFTSGTFVTGYNNINVNNVTTYNVTGLTSSTTYYYRVRAGNGCDTSLYSNTITVSTSAPVAPNAVAASNFTCTSVNANWGAVTGATAYYLEVATSASFGVGTFVTGYNNVNVNNVTTYNVTGLTSSTTYYYRVRAGNGCDTSLYSNTITVSTSAPVAPTATAPSNFTCTSMNANWGAVSGATAYYLEVATSASFGAGTFVTGYNNINVNNVTTYNVTGLTSSTTYYYRVRAGNGCDTSLYSNTITVSTSAPVAPNAVAASNFTCTSVNANWGAVTGATAYYLEVATSASFGAGTFVTGYNNINVNNVTTYNVTGLTSSTTYYYRVRAGNGCDTSLYSNTITVSTSAPVAPNAVAASNFTCTSVNANWGAVTGATTYYLEVATSASFGAGTFVTGYNNINVNNVTTYNVTGLTSSTTYYYRVRAGNGCDTSLYSNTITVSTSAPVAPNAVAASNFTCTSVNANWGAVTGATTYYLEVATSASFGAGTFVTGYNNINVNNVTTYNVTGLTSSTTYYYRVRAGNGCDTSLYSNTITVSTSAPVAPTATTPSNFTCTSLNANWGAVAGATAYYLEVATSASFGAGTFVTGYNNVNVNNVTTYNVTGLTSSTTYYYRVRAGNGCDTSLYSNTITVSTSAPVAPTATAPSNFTCTSINANWGAVSGATTYYLEVATTATFTSGTFVTGYNNINVNNVTTYNVTGLTSSTTYYYRVRAGNGCDTSLYSNTITVSTSAPVAPTATAPSNFTCTSINANWGAVSGATTYYLEVATSASFGAGTFVTGYNNINVNNVTTYNVIGLTSSTTYYYRVRAGNGCDTSLYSNTITVSTSAPVAPNAVAASNFTCTSMNANWGAVSGATAYYLEIATSASFGAGTFVTGYNNVNVNNVTTYNVTGLTSSTTYYYRVRAGNGCDTSLYSNTITVSTSAPIAPNAVAATNFTCTSMNANWGAVSGATAYYLEVATSASFGAGTFVTGYNNVNVNNVTTYNITGLTSSTTYYYRVRAGNGCDTSLYSNTITVSTSAPVAPNAIAASNFTCTSLNANWGAVSGATTYYLEVATSASFGAGTFVTGYNNVNVNNVTTYNVTGLTSSTTYYYRVRAGNGCDTSLYSNTITVGTSAPVAPNALAASNFTCTSLNANWGAVSGATAYYLEVATSASFGAGTFVSGYNNVNVNNVTTYNVTGLTSSTTYYYRVRAGNGCDTSLYSNTIAVGTSAPIAPNALTASNFTCTSMNANWGAVSGATAYYLEVATTATFTSGTFVTGYNNVNVNNVTTYNITGLTSSTTYYYRVRAGNGCDTSLYSNTITAGTSAPIAPTAVIASNFTCTSMNANWGAVSGATAYYLEVATSASFGAGTFVSGYNNVNVNNVTTYNVTGLTSSTTYYYRVRAGNGCDTSLYSNTITAGTTAPIAPTVTAASNFTCTSMNANWGAVSGATAYYLEVATSASFGAGTFVTGYNNVNVNNVTTYNVTGLTSNTSYYYRVRAGNGCDTSSYSNTITVSTSAPVAPTAIAASNFTCTSMNANWGTVSGATTYYLEVATSASFGSGTFVSGYNNLNVNNVTTKNVVGLTSNTTYYYRVRAGNGCDTSSYSNTITFITTAPIAPNALAASNFTCTSFNANWGVVSGATAYYLQVATNASFASGTFVAGYTNLNVNNTTTKNVTGLTPSTSYYYRVRAGNGCDTSSFSNTITVIATAPNAPAALAATNFTCTSMNANWGAVPGATAYYLQVATSASFGAGTFVSGFNNVNVNNVTTKNVTGLTSNTTYYYRVRAGNGCDTSSFSNTITFITTAPIAPNALAASNFTCTSLNANWGTVTGATTYYLEVATSASFGAGTFVAGFNNVNVNNVTTKNVTGLTPSTTYYYRVRAGNGCDTSLYSNTISVVTTAPLAPTAVAASNFTCTSMNANWSASAGATTYFLDVATDAAFTTFVGAYNNINVNNVTTYNITGLTVNVTYYYRLRASNGCSTSLNSNTITVSTTAPVAPTATAASNFTCTSLNANWGAVTGATAYMLDVATDASFTSFVPGYNNLNVGNTTTTNVTGLTVNTTYYYRIRALNGCSTSLNSNTITVSTSAPISPTAITASNFTCTSFNANWGAVSGATGYFIDVATDAGFTAFVGSYNNLNVNNVTTYNITGLTVNTTYFYRVRAANGCSISLNSNTIMVITSAPLAPVAIAASNYTCNSMNANWSASTGATAYYIDVSTSPAFSSFFGTYNNLNVNNVTTYNITGLTLGTTYYYRVRAGNGCSTSSNSNTINVTITAPDAPQALSPTNVVCLSMNANWGASPGAITYFLDVATDASFTAFVAGYNNLNVNNVLTYNVTGLSAGVTYYYRVRAANGCSASLNSNFIVVQTSALDAPNATAATSVACTSFNANWGAVSGVINYFLDISTNPSFSSFVGSYNNLNVGNVTTYSVTGLTLNTTYYYRVRAMSGCTTSSNSNTITASTNAPNAPVATAATNITCTSLNANWSAVSGAITYYIDVATDAGFTAFVGAYNNFNVGNVTTYNLTGLPGTTVYYRVRAASGCASGNNSNFITVNPSAINAPVALAASGIACTVFNANWAAASGAIGYFLDVSTSPSFATFETGYNNLNVNNVTSYNVTGLTVNTTYYYRIRAINACVTSPNSNSITASTNAPNAPVATAATNVTCTSLNANWSAVTGAITYYIDVATDASFTAFVGAYNNFNVGNVTTYNLTGLPGTTVYYRVRAASGCASGNNSNFVMVNPSAINSPVASAATGVACTVFNANWTSVTGAIAYFLDVSTSPSFSTFIAGYNNLNVGLVLSYNVTGLTVNTTYYYRLRSMNACVTSSNSNSITASTNAPAAPVATAVSNVTCTSMNANWNSVPGAITYYLDVATDAAFTAFVAPYNNFNAGNVTTYNATGLPGTTVYYRVRAASGCASGGNSNFIVVNPAIINAPNATAASSITCTFLNANWQAVSGAIAYEIDVSTTPAFTSFLAGYNALNVGNVLTKNVTGLTINTNYYYRIRALNACVTSLNSNTITASTFAPNAPVANAASNLTCSSMNANWAAASGALNYLLDVSTDPAFGTFVGSYNALNVGNVTTYNITGLVASTIYYYRVRAVNGCSASGYSNIRTAATTPPAQPTANAVTSFTCTSFIASWGAVGGATSYSLDVSNDPAFGTFIAGFNDLNVGNVLNRNVTGLAAGITYYYRVRTNNNCGTSSSSNSIAYTISAPTIPDPGTTAIGCTSFSFCWALCAGATNYFLDVSTNASFSSFVAGYNNLSMGNVSCKTVTGLTNGLNYYYRIRSANSCGSSGNSANLTVPLYVPGAPTVTNTSITAISCVSFEAIWTGTLGATSYFLDVSTSPAFGTFVGVFNNFNAGSLTSFDVTGLTPGVTYYYRVRGANGCGTSLNSSTVIVTTAVPAAPVSAVATDITATTFSANWAVSADATTYYLDVATDATFTNYVTGYNNINVGNVLTYSVTGLTTGTTYYYRVRASNGCNTSGNSTTKTLTTL